MRSPLPKQTSVIWRSVSLVALTVAWAFFSKAEIPDSRWTHPNLAYGSHPRQVMDVWLPVVTGRVPVVMFVHGGGWTKGNRREEPALPLLDKCGWRKCAFIAVEYRFLSDAEKEGIKPPVRAPMEDVASAVAFVRRKAGAWGVDPDRIGLIGGSAGACASLACAFADGNAFGIRAVAALWPQTSLDPREMRAWVPNISYGARAFGYATFDEWLAHRADCLKWIERFSPAALIRKCPSNLAPRILTDPPVLPLAGKLPDDPTHAGVFRVKMRELCERRAIGYEEVPPPQIYGRLMESLVN